jgi:hypothetical protein
MQIGLTNAYSLVPMTVSPDELLLDPTNPRLITESAQFRSYGPEVIRTPETQEHVLKLVCSKEHGVKELISSIKEFGFISGYQDIIVKQASGTSKLLVLEGNRRTAAIRYLRRSGGKLRPDVEKSIETIPVKKFVYKPNSEFDESRVIDILLGSIHIDGPREWGALERAAFVLRSYLRECGSKKRLRYDLAIARRVGSTFRMSPKMVHKCLTVALVYEQFRNAKLPVEPKHYTLIDLATKTRSVATEYFGLDDESCELSDQGVERFAALCLGDSPPIHNPKLFNAFVTVKTEGSELELAQVEAGERDLEEVCDAIRVRMKRRAFRENLAAVREHIASLNVGEYQGTEGEKEEIRRIQRQVDDVLVPLIRNRKAG